MNRALLLTAVSHLRSARRDGGNGHFGIISQADELRRNWLYSLKSGVGSGQGGFWRLNLASGYTDQPWTAFFILAAQFAEIPCANMLP